MTEEQAGTLLDAADTVGGVAERINYLLNDVCAVLGPVPFAAKLDEWAAELFRAAHLIRRTADPGRFPQ